MKLKVGKVYTIGPFWTTPSYSEIWGIGRIIEIGETHSMVEMLKDVSLRYKKESGAFSCHNSNIGVEIEWG